MNKKNIPFQAIDWTEVPRTEHPGEPGISYWQTMQFEGLRVRLVEYVAGYVADHWCSKGHIVHCLEGEFTCAFADGRERVISRGMTFVVTDEMSSHRTATEHGAKLLIVDGDFLKPAVE